MQEEPAAGLARQALQKTNFPLFFHHLANVSEYLRYQLAMEAVEAAKELPNIAALHQLAAFDVGKFFGEKPFGDILRALVKLRATEATLSVVVFINKQLEIDIRWYIFAKVLLIARKIRSPSANTLFIGINCAKVTSTAILLYSSLSSMVNPFTKLL